jgi:hypothetical protein
MLGLVSVEMDMIQGVFQLFVLSRDRHYYRWSCSSLPLPSVNIHSLRREDRRIVILFTAAKAS